MCAHRTDIRLASSPADVAAVKTLFQEYADFLGIDLCFQDFDEEMATFPQAYDCLLLARVDGEAAAAVGLKDFGDGACEMKRLYARPAFRGLGLGRRLCVVLIKEARRRGYQVMRLDTLEWLDAAVALYREFGFREIDPYYENPHKGVVYMELPLNGDNGKKGI